MAESNSPQPHPSQPQTNQIDVAQPSSPAAVLGTAADPAMIHPGATTSQTQTQQTQSQSQSQDLQSSTPTPTDQSQTGAGQPETESSLEEQTAGTELVGEETKGTANTTAQTPLDPVKNEHMSPQNSNNSNNNDHDDKQDITMGGTEPEGGNATAGAPTTGVATTNGASASGATSLGVNGIDPMAHPTKKDTSLREFLGQMDEYAPIIPDAVTAHYLTVAGLPPPGNGPNHTPPHLARLLALATQKFVADIAADAYQYSRIRSSNSASSNNPMGSINVTAGLSSAANQSAAAQSSGAGGAAAGATGGPSAAGGGEGTVKSKTGSGGLHLGVQRAGFGGGGQGGSQGKTVLTMEDLGMALGEYGVSVKRGEFYR